MIAGRASTTTLDGGDGQDIMIGDKYGKETIFKLGTEGQAWDDISDMIQGFGTGDKLDLSRLGISDNTDLTAVGDILYKGDVATGDKIADFTNFNNGLSLDDLLIDANAHIIYAGAA